MSTKLNRSKETAYVAFLRGINVGGNTLVPMAKLIKAFETLKFSDIKTVLASGNVIFNTPKDDPLTLRIKIENEIEEVFKRHFDVIVYSIDGLKKLVARNPFKGVNVTPETRMYATFLMERPESAKIPSSLEGFRILNVNDGVILSTFDLAPNRGSVDLMSYIEKEYGKKVTTRSWSTVLKIIKAGGG
ncbi:MAG TPA: DUF1697 domain-containing protein [Candidatus Paceibacterota bacterium]|nr:DUF1697 domain-containing protein [Candidatus Paceibacterota bacterium]